MFLEISNSPFNGDILPFIYDQNFKPMPSLEGF